MIDVSGGALSGKRILVTRAREQSDKTIAAITAHGAEAIVLPTIAIGPPKDPGAAADAIARAHAGAYAWVVFTSANGVAWTLGSGGPGTTPATRAPFGPAKIAVIGKATEEALAAHGLAAAVVAEESRGEGLAADLLRAMAPGENVLLLRAQVGRPALPDALRGAGHPVDVVAVYATRPASPADANANANANADGQGEGSRILGDLAAGRIDAVTFTSASTVEGFVGLAGGERRARDLLGKALIACIGPVTREALEEHGLPCDVVPPEATLGSLLEAMGARFASGPFPFR